MTTGMILTVAGITGIAVTLIIQAVLIPVFRRQKKHLLEELSKE